MPPAPHPARRGLLCGTGVAPCAAADLYHINFARAIGRRLRRTYTWIFVIQAIAYYGKLAIHPTPLTSFARTLGTCRHWPDPGRLGHCCGSAFSWRLGRGRACHPSHRDRLATRTAHPDRDGISRSRGPIHQRALARA
ncbi:MAG: DUF2270 domain-containing protein [Rhodoplanes sp.]